MPKASMIDRFNQDPKESDFISYFQDVMIQRLNLNHIDKFHPENVEKIVKSTLNRSSRTINTKIANGMLLTCNVEPELYINIQETAKKITGDYMPMDELIHLLLTYFCYVYQGKLPKNELPYKHVFKGHRLRKLNSFQGTFRKYYGNVVRSFME